MSHQKLLKAHNICKEVRIVLQDIIKEVKMPLPSSDVFNNIEDFNLPEDILSTAKKESLLQIGPLISVRGLQFPIASEPVNQMKEKIDISRLNVTEIHTVDEYINLRNSGLSDVDSSLVNDVENLQSESSEFVDSILLDGSDIGESDVESIASYNSDSEISDAENMLVDYESNSDTGSVESFRVKAMSRTKIFSTEKQLLARKKNELGKFSGNVLGKGIGQKYNSDIFLSFNSVEYDNVISVLTANFENRIITIVTNKFVEFWEKQRESFLKIGELERRSIIGSVLLTTSCTRTEMWNMDVAVYCELWASSHIFDREPFTNFKVKIFKCEMQKLLCTTIDLGNTEGLLEIADFCFLPDCSILMAWSKQKQSPTDFLGYVCKFYINNTWDKIKKHKILDALLSKVTSVCCVEGSPSEVIVHARPLIILYNHEKYTIRTLHMNKILEKFTSNHLLNVPLYDLYWAEAENTIKTHRITLLFKSDHHMHLISWDKNTKKAERVKQFIVPDMCEGMIGTTVANSLVGCVFKKYIAIWNKNLNTPVCHIELEGDIRACSGSEGIVIFQDSKLKTATLEEIMKINTYITK